MNLDNIPKKKRPLIIGLLMLPLLISVIALFALRLFWQVDIAPGEKFSPIENKPLFIGILLFAVGYLFFIGILFSDNIRELFNNRFSIERRR